MSSDTADDDYERRKSDRSDSEHAVEPDPQPADEGEAAADPAPASAAPTFAPVYARTTDRAAEGDDDLDGEGESDASEADQIDDPGTTPVVLPHVAPVRGRRRTDSDVHDDGRAYRRRRSDEPRARAPYDYAHDDAAPTKQRGRGGWIAATVVFVLLFGGAAALDYYLWNTAEEWEERAGQLTEINYDLGARLSAEQQTTLQLTSELDLLTQQLATSNQKVTDLSSEKASAVDESAYYLQQIDALETDVSTAAGVANALRRCVDGQQELVTYLSDAESYEPEELADFQSSVRALCAEAESANDRLQEVLSE